MATGGLCLDVEESESRWLVVGLAMNKVLVPELKKFVAQVLQELHEHLREPPISIDSQSFGQELTHYPPKVPTLTVATAPKKAKNVFHPKPLQYSNINSNLNKSKKDTSKWDYNVTTPIDLAKLFLQPYMAKCTSFQDCDCSALLTLIREVDDSPCQDLLRNVRREAKELKEIRNMWARCKYSEWEDGIYQNAFDKMEGIIKGLNVDRKYLRAVQDWRDNGLHFHQRQELLEEKMKNLEEAQRILAAELQVMNDWTKTNELQNLELQQSLENICKEVAELKKKLGQVVDGGVPAGDCSYREKLNDFHCYQTLQKLPYQKLLTTYMDSIVFVAKPELEYQGQREGLREFVRTQQRKAEVVISPDCLFKCNKVLGEDTDPRRILLLGVPGIGKTSFCFKLLDDIIKNGLHFGEKEPIPFLIRFREMNLIKTATTFQDLLLSNSGPTLEERAKQSAWRFLCEHEEQVTILLDGYDEYEGLGVNVKSEFTQPFSSVDVAKEPALLLYNLIRGNILPKANVLVTSRPFCAPLLRNIIDRTVELDGLGVDKIEAMIQSEFQPKFPKVSKSLIKYLLDNQHVLGLCYVPRHANCLISYVRDLTDDNDVEVKQDKMPQTMASLLLIMVLYMMKISDLDRNSQSIQEVNEVTILEKRSSTLKKLAQLAYEGLFSGTGVKQLFSDADIKQCGLAKEELGCGVMSGYELTRPTLMSKKSVCFLHSFPHLTVQELLAGIRLLQMESAELTTLVRKNKGEYDMVWLLYFGLSGDKMLNRLLPIIYPETLPGDYEEKAQVVLEALFESERSKTREAHLYLLNALSESQLWYMADDLTSNLVDIWGVWDTDYDASRMTPADHHAITMYLSRVRSPLSAVRVFADKGSKHLQAILQQDSLQGFSGVQVSGVSEEHLEFMRDLTSTHGFLQSLRVDLGDVELSTPLTSEDNRTIQQLCLSTPIPNAQWFLQNTVHLKSLDTLALAGCTMVHAPSWASVLRHIPKVCDLKYLGMVDCGLKVEDVKAVAEVLLECHLAWLDVSINEEIGDEGCKVLAKSLTSADCRLEGLRVRYCGISEEGQMELCSSLHGHRFIKTLEMDLDEIEPAVKMLGSSKVLEELDINFETLSDENSMSVSKALENNKSLKVLCLGITDEVCCEKNFLNIPKGHPLECLQLTGGIRDADFHCLTKTLPHTSIQMLHLYANTPTSVQNLVELITSCHLQLLDLCGCRLGEAGWQQVAAAVCHAPQIHTVSFGELTEASCAVFLEELVRSFPYMKPLKALYCRHKATSRLTSLVQALKDKLESIKPDVYYGVEKGLMRLHNRQMWCSLPDDRRKEIYNSIYYS